MNQRQQLNYLMSLFNESFKAALTTIKNTDEIIMVTDFQIPSGIQSEIAVSKTQIVVRIGFLNTDNFTYMGLDTSIVTAQIAQSNIELFVQSHLGLYMLEAQFQPEAPGWKTESTFQKEDNKKLLTP